MKKEIKPEQIWNEEKIKGVKKLIQKQKLIDMMGQDEELGLYDEPKIKCYCGHTSYCDCRPEQYFKDIEFPQQEIPKTLEEAQKQQFNYDNLHDAKEIASKIKIVETLEEAAERFVNSTRLKNPKSLFCEGAKWEQEQIGKSEFLQKLRGTKSNAEARRLIFETFKNK